MNSYKSGESFIDHIYQELINSDEVKKAINRRGINPKNREEAVKYYMERIEHAHNTRRKIDILKRFYYKKYVIDHLPESYVERQWRIAREQGQGNIRITNEIKRKMLEDIQSEQKKSIDRWLDYLNSPDAMYPMWFKYYAFQGVIKLGKFDKEKKKFGKRTKDTTNQFIEVNPEILGQMYTILSKMIEKQELTKEETKSLEKGESFQKLYTSLLIQMEENRISNGTSTEGIWIKYEQGDNYQELWQSLQGKNTGWCTAGEEMCRRQIKNGDFYVYYSYDNDGNPINPRIAIRMDGHNKIAEVRGIKKQQNLEPEMVEIANAKLKDFPYDEGKKYQKKVHDMKKLTIIERKTKNDEELTKDEIVFLYELESNIDGFGWLEDPRIKEIIEKRIYKGDLKKINEAKVIRGIQRNPELLKYVPVDIPNYEMIAFEAAKRLGHVLKYIPTNTPNYKEIAIEAVKQNYTVIELVPIDVPNYKEIAIEAVRKKSSAIEYIPTNTPNYTEIAIEAVKQNYTVIKLVPIDVPNYKEIALALLRQINSILITAPTDGLNNEQIALEAVKQNFYALPAIPTDIPNYVEIAIEAVKKAPIAMKFVPTDIPNYDKIALETVKQNWRVLEYVPANISNYTEIVKEAVKQSSDALEFISKDISNYEQFFLEALKNNRHVLKKIPRDFEFKIPEIALEAVKINGLALKYVSKDISNYETIAMEAIKQNGLALKYVSKDISNYESVAMEAIKKNSSALVYVSKSVSNYEKIAMEAVKLNGMALRYVPEKVLNYEEIAMEAVKENEQALAYVSEYTPNYVDIAYKALKRAYNLYQQSDELEASINDPDAFYYLEREYNDLLDCIPENLVGEVEEKLHNNLYGKSR